MAEAQKTEGTFKIKKPTEKQTEAPAAVEQEVPSGPASISEDGSIKLDLSKPVESNANKEQETAGVVTGQQTEIVQEVETEIPQQQESVQTQESVQELENEFLQEITDEEVVEAAEELEEQVEAAIVEQSAGIDLPENIQKVVNFINETGGSLEDYVKLNVDYDSLDEDQLLREFYQTSKPHLNSDEVAFLLDENFAFDEDVDEDRDVIKKKIARKEELSKAKTYL